jgi:D-glycero-beta-D-manno-heptose-7-phosphate kinase
MAKKHSDTISNLFEQFNNYKVLIIGDVMVDAYMWGHVSRISPEAPVPIVAVNKRENRLGGAANVALNVQAMGATPYLCSVIGNDENSKLLIDLLNKQKLSNAGIIKSTNRVTTVKTRVIGNNHQMLRVDEEIETPISEKEKSKLLQVIQKIVLQKKIDVIVFEDYDKGCITAELIKDVVSFAKQKNIPTVVDPKKRNFMDYKGVTLFKPNLKELKEGLKQEINVDNIKSFADTTQKFLHTQKIDIGLITLSEKGMFLQNENKYWHIPAHQRDIADVSGAGDTVVSIASLCLASKTSPETLVKLSNLAGGLVCEKVGVVPVNKKQLLAEAHKLIGI